MIPDVKAHQKSQRSIGTEKAVYLCVTYHAELIHIINTFLHIPYYRYNPNETPYYVLLHRHIANYSELAVMIMPLTLHYL